MDRETHRAYVDAGMMPLADYVAQYGDEEDGDQPELPFTPQSVLGGLDRDGKPIIIDTSTIGSR